MWPNFMFWPIDALALKREGSTPVKTPARKPTPQMIPPPRRRRAGAVIGSAKGKTVLAVEGSDDTGATKKAKASDPDKEVAGCVACRALAAADKPGGCDKQYCKIHHTKGHDLQNCRQAELLAEKQKAEYERRDKEKAQEGAGGAGKKRPG